MKATLQPCQHVVYFALRWDSLDINFTLFLLKFLLIVVMTLVKEHFRAVPIQLSPPLALVTHLYSIVKNNMYVRVFIFFLVFGVLDGAFLFLVVQVDHVKVYYIFSV